MKICTLCKNSKILSDFYNDKRTKDGCTCYCKECIKEKSRKYKEEHGQSSSEARKKYNRDYYEKNKDHLVRKSTIYKKNNPGKVKEYDINYKLKNRELLNERQKKYASSLKGRASQITRRKRRRDRMNETDDGTITMKALFLLGEAQFHKCFHCKEALDYKTPSAIHLDHIIPLSKGGKHTLSNVKWSCALCNLKKGSKII